MKNFSLSFLCMFGLGACCCCRGAAPAEQPATQTAGPQGPMKTAKVEEPAQPPAAVKSANRNRTADQEAARPHRAAAPIDPAHLRTARTDALEWLAAHQRDDGSWEGEGNAKVNKVGLTGLALLALQSDGSTTSSGAHARSVARGIDWLVSQQEADLGVVGPRTGHSFGYDHAIATQAMCIALRAAPDEKLRRASQNAVNFITRMRNPYGAWRYSYPPTGDSDTSVTGWMVEALIAAQAAGLSIDPEAYVGAKQWIDDVTDPATARIGYDTIGSSSSRVTGLNDQFPTDQHEAMTASGMVTRLNTGTPADPMLPRHALLLQKHPPEWDPQSNLVDEYYWYFGSIAMHRLGGNSWDTWRGSAQEALLTGQQQSGEGKGSWDPVGPWAFAGGRVYATSLNALSLSTML
ncbi:MAG: prenyltransferase/squalene oxidase repeat-containing protein [Planctomycetota bacterium]